MLILKQNTPNSVPTPPAGKGTIFLSDQDVLSVKTSDGNVEAFPTVGGSNTQIFYNNQNAIDGSPNLVWNSSTQELGVTGTANVSGNIAVGGIKTDNYYYANGQPLDFEQPAGSNTQVIYNNGGNFGASANFTFNSATNVLTVGGNIGASNVNAGNLLTANYVSGTLTTAAQPNITSVGTLSTLTTSGNAIIGGNLTVNGNITYINVETFDVEDPIISVGGGPNGAPLTSNDGKDRGLLMHYYTSAPVDAYMGWDNSNSEFAFGSNVTVSTDVVTFNALGNARASNFLGNVVGATANLSGNVTAANANLGNLVTANFVTGTLTTAAQPNITSVGVLTSLEIGATADKANDFPNAKTVSSQDNTGDGLSAPIGLAGEAVADSGNIVQAFGLYGVARANGAAKGTGVQGTALVTNTADTGAAVGVRGYSTATHAGGYNIGVLGNAIGSGVGNYAFYIQNGGIASIENTTFWDLTDNSNAALTFNSTGKANIFGIETTDNAEGIFTSGYLNVVGNAAVGGIKTDNYYYANGSPVDFQQAGGSNTQVQFNDADGFGGSAAFTFDKTTNAVSMGGTLTVTGNASAGNISTGGVLSVTGNANVGNLGTAGLIVATGNVTGGNLVTAGALSATGNANVGNLGTGGLIVATGNVTGGNLVTGGVVSATGNVSGGNLTTGGVITATGNITGGNISGTLLTGTLTTNAQPNITSVGTLTSLAVTGNITAGNVSATTFTGALTGAATTAGTVTDNAQPNITSVGTLTSLGVSGNITAANITANTGIFTGNGSGLSALAGGNVTGQVANSLVAGTVYTAAQPNITSVGTLSSLAVTANVAAGNLTTTGVLTVSGTGVSSIAGNLDMTSNNIINLASPTNPNDAATKQYVDDIAQGLHTHDACNAATPDTLANVTSGTVTYNNGTSGVGATLTTTGTFNLIDGVNVQTSGTRILVKNEANSAHNGIYVWSNATVITRADDFDTPTEMAGGDFTFVSAGTLYDNTGWVMTDPVTTVGTSPVPWVQFSGAGTYTAGTGLTLTGSVFSVNASQTQITSVGTLTGLNVNGTVTASAFTANTGIFTGNGSGLTALAGGNVTGQVANALVAGTVYTAAQPNITSVGTLTSLGVSGNITAANITANTGIFAGNGSGLTDLNASNISSGTLAQARLANASLTVNGQSISLGGSGTITANTTQTLTLGSYLTGTSFNGGTAVTAAVDATTTNTASKVVARDASGNFAAGTITATLSGAATTAGTVTTAAQPNITSVGTLTGLTVSGATSITSNSALTTTNITSGANTTAGYMTGNWTLTAGSRFNATYADLAERYVADAEYEPGTVLLFGGEHEVTMVGTPDSTRVAGVVTTNPAYLMNSDCAGEFVVDIALIGRVPIKVQGPIAKGDLLVTSEQPGFAKANNEARAGTIIGKALQSYNGPTPDGVIEAMVGRC